jgi:hypothetical protein
MFLQALSGSDFDMGEGYYARRQIVSQDTNQSCHSESRSGEESHFRLKSSQA